MLILRPIIILFFHFLCILTFSQNQIKGRIIDATTQQPIPFANISVKESLYGTISDIDGFFFISIKKIPVQLQISFVGYETKILTIDKITEKTLQISLYPQTYVLPELTIKAGENPAHRIIRKALEMRNINNPEQVQSFQYTSYNKLYFTIDKKSIIYSYDTIKVNSTKTQKYRKIVDDTTTNQISAQIDSFFSKSYLFLSESVTRKYFQKPDKNKEIVLFTKTSGLKQPYFIMLATQFQSFSFYNDFVTILDKKYLNPISNQAIGRYFYELNDTLINENGDSIFVISFRPLKNTLFDGLKGVMHINTNRYAIQTIQAEPAKTESNISIRIQQLYSFINSQQWFPTQLNTDIKVSFLQLQDKNDTLRLNDSNIVIVKKTLPLKGIGKSYIDSILINSEIPLKIFNEISVELKKNAHIIPDTAWNNYRTETFGDVEKNTYRTIDSIGQSIKLDKFLMTFEYLLSGYVPIKFINLNIKNIFDFNRFEGLRINLDIKTNEKVSKYWSVGGYVGYGFNDKEIKKGGAFYLTPFPISEFLLSFSFKNDVRETGSFSFFDDKNFFENENLRRIYINLMDYHTQYKSSIIFRSFKYFKNQFCIANNNLFLNPLNWFYNNDSLISVINYNEASIGIKFLYKEQFFQTLKGKYSLGSKYPTIYLNFHVGKIKSTYSNFIKSEIKFIAPISFGLYGKSLISFIGGYTPNNIPLPLLYNGKGTKFMDISLYADHSFTTMKVNEFFYNQFLFCFIKHDFGKILFQIGKFKPGLAIHHNMAIGNLRQSEYYKKNTTNKLFTESGIQVYNLFSKSFNSFGIGIFYRYGNYSLLKFKDNLALKITFSFLL